jgi:hypothetical protein
MFQTVLEQTATSVSGHSWHHICEDKTKPRALRGGGSPLVNDHCIKEWFEGNAVEMEGGPLIWAVLDCDTSKF